MFAGWFGNGKLIHSMDIKRSGVKGNVVDRVQAVVLYQNHPVTFYHGFNQPKILDRQELRLQFDHGDITLYEWIPVRIRLHGLVKEVHLEKAKQLFPGCAIEHHSNLSGKTQTVRGKFRDIHFDSKITLTAGDIADKMERYEQLVIAMIRDQWEWIRDRAHIRIVEATHAVESLRIAEEATHKAEHF
jgi:hypothetical protein